MRDDVQDFISRRWGEDSPRWTDGNCYWFAFILCERFPLLEMYYLPVSGHFVAGFDGEYFDATGTVEPPLDDQPILLKTINEKDPIWYSHILRDCRM